MRTLAHAFITRAPDPNAVRVAVAVYIILYFWSHVHSVAVVVF